MKTIEDISGIIPNEKARIFSEGVHLTRIAGNNIREKIVFVKVRGHHRIINGKRVYIRPHPDSIKDIME